MYIVLFYGGDLMNADSIFLCIWIYAIIQIIPICEIGTLSIFNPMTNYQKWNKLNWFGVILGTLILHILFLPNAIVYWSYKLITVNRK